MTQGQEKNEPKELTLVTSILKLADETVKAAVITICKLKFIHLFSQSQFNLSLPHFVILELESTNTSLLPAGTMKSLLIEGTKRVIARDRRLLFLVMVCF